MRTILLCLVAAAVLSGCTESAPVQETGSGAADEMASVEPMEVEPINFTDTWNLNGAGAGVIAFVDVTSDHAYEFTLPRGGETTITSEWSCASGPACMLRLYLFDDGEAIREVSGTGPLQIQAELAAGTYTVETFPMYEASVAVDAQGTYEVVLA